MLSRFHISGKFLIDLKSIISLSLGNVSSKSITSFEKNFSKYVYHPNCLAVASGRLGLYMILKKLNIPKGSEIIMQALNFHVVPKIVSDAGYSPSFVDVDEETFNISFSQLKKKINAKTRAIIITHTFGNPCDIQPIMKMCQDNSIYLIEDCAHALGAKIDNKHVGTFGDAAFFSFETVKHINTFGGGMILLKNPQLKLSIEKEINQWSVVPSKALFFKMMFSIFERVISNRYIYSMTIAPLLKILELMGKDEFFLINFYKKKKKKAKKFNFKYSPIQAKAGLIQLKEINHLIKKRQAHAQKIYKQLKGFISCQKIYDKMESSFYLFVVRTYNSRHFIKTLHGNGLDGAGNVLEYCPHDYNDYSEILAAESRLEYPNS